MIYEFVRDYLRNEGIQIVGEDVGELERALDIDPELARAHRALAGLDSIAQAAGRCNREGHLPDLGEVVVFVPPDAAPAPIRVWISSMNRIALGLSTSCLSTEAPLA